MNGLEERIVEEAMTLPADMRARLVGRLLESLNLPRQEEIERLWAEEAERRVEDVRSGKVKPIPGEQVFAQIRQRLAK